MITAPYTIRMPPEAMLKLKYMAIASKTPVCKIVEQLIEAEWKQQEDKVTDTITNIRAKKELNKVYKRATKYGHDNKAKGQSSTAEPTGASQSAQKGAYRNLIQFLLGRHSNRDENEL